MTGIDDNLIRLVQTVYYETLIMSEEINKNSPGKVMIIRNQDNDTLTRYHAEAFHDYFTTQGFESTNIIQGDFHSDHVVEIDYIKGLIVSEEPDAIMIASSNTDAAPFINYIKGLNLGIEIHLTSWAGTNILDRIDSVNNDDIYIYNDSSKEEDSPKYLLHKIKFLELYGQNPDMLSINGYDAMYMIFNALLEENEYTADGIKASLLATRTFSGINDDFIIDEYGDNERPVYKYIIVEGELVEIE